MHSVSGINPGSACAVHTHNRLGTYLLRPRCKLQAADGLVGVGTGGAHRGDHGCLAVSPEGALQNAREL